MSQVQMEKSVRLQGRFVKSRWVYTLPTGGIVSYVVTTSAYDQWEDRSLAFMTERDGKYCFPSVIGLPRAFDIMFWDSPDWPEDDDFQALVHYLESQGAPCMKG